MTSITSTDCNTADADVYRNVGGLANDADFDGHYIGSVGTQCVGDSFALNVAQAGDPSDFKIFYDDTSGTSYWIVANQAYSGSDCDNTLKYMGPTRTEHTDGDSDGYTVTVSSFCARYLTWGNSACSSGGSSYSKNSAGTCKLISSLSGTDCYDSNADVKPGQTSFFTTDRGDGSFDYNCDSAVTTSVGTKYINCDCGTCFGDFCSNCQPTGGSSTTESDCGFSRQVACTEGFCSEQCRERSCCDRLNQVISCR